MDLIIVAMYAALFVKRQSPDVVYCGVTFLISAVYPITELWLIHSPYHNHFYLSVYFIAAACLAPIFDVSNRSSIYLVAVGLVNLLACYYYLSAYYTNADRLIFMLANYVLHFANILTIWVYRRELVGLNFLCTINHSNRCRSNKNHLVD